MNRDYRFARIDDGAPATAEMTLVCASDADALALGAALGGLVEVWDGARRVGLAGLGVPKPANAEAAPCDDTSRAFNPFRSGDWRRLNRG